MPFPQRIPLATLPELTPTLHARLRLRRHNFLRHRQGRWLGHDTPQPHQQIYRQPMQVQPEVIGAEAVVAQPIHRQAALDLLVAVLTVAALDILVVGRLGEQGGTGTTLSPERHSTLSLLDAQKQSIAGYEVLSELGRGGMGVVYIARQKGLGRLVALKMILHADHAGSEERLRFQREAEALAQLKHEHIVQIYEVGEVEGTPFISLEYVEGGSLAKRLNGTPLPVREAAVMAEQFAKAIAAAHGTGVVHRDLKPANVLLAVDGTPKVADFGLALRLDIDDRQTRTGAVMGSPAYMAPEQALGQTRCVGPAADEYALGAILYEMLIGRPPFKAATVLETLDLVHHQEAVNRSTTH